MKKFLIAAFTLVAGVSIAMAGMGIQWDNGGGWAVVFGGDLDNGPGLADANDVLWQLIYAGENNVADDIDLSAANFLGGDDQLLADRSIPTGGGSAADGTSWDSWLQNEGGETGYQDLDWKGTGSFVYQRIFQGLPDEGTYYYQTDLFEYNKNYAGGGAAPDVFGFSDGAGVAMDQQIPGSGPEPPEPPTVPEPATMSLLGLGALAMVLRRKLSK